MENSLVITQEGIHSLSVTRKWTLFLSIVGFIMSGIMVAFGFFFALVGSKFLPPPQSGGEFPSYIFFFLYVVFGVVYYFPSRYLYKFSTMMKTAIETQAEQTLNGALRYLRSFFTFAGILMIISLAFMVLAVFAGIMAALFISGSPDTIKS